MVKTTKQICLVDAVRLEYKPVEITIVTRSKAKGIERGGEGGGNGGEEVGGDGREREIQIRT